MRVPTAVYVMFGIAVTLDISAPISASAQVPTVERARPAMPARGAVIETAEPVPAQAPAALPPGQPAVAPAAAAPAAAAPAEPAPVSAAPAPSGVTQLPPAAAPPATASSSSAATAVSSRSYGSGNFALKLDGIPVGSLKSLAGGAALGDVVVERLGPDKVAKKHLGGIRYEEISFEVGFSAKPITDWIAASWKGSSARKNGSIQLADYNYNVRGEREFTSALITGTTIPTLDGGSKEPGFLTVTLAPEAVRQMAGSGRLASADVRGKQWMTSNFRFEMDGLDATRVIRIDSFTVSQRVTENPVGEMRDYEKEPAGIVFPNLKVTMAEVSAPSWAKWHEDFVVNGKSSDSEEKNGAIIFLDSSRSNELGRVNLFHCGIFRFGSEPAVAHHEGVARVTADLYCERMELVSK
ncbi:MAG: hypothetical protein ABI703_05070 [Gemmatimonadales bacterium]